MNQLTSQPFKLGLHALLLTSLLLFTASWSVHSESSGTETLPEMLQPN